MTVVHRITRAPALERRVQSLFLPANGAAGGGPGRVGVEVELFPVRRCASGPAPVSIAEVTAALAQDPSLAVDARLSYEPGGQVELSPAPSASPAAALDTVTSLIARLRRCGEREGIHFASAGVSPWHDQETIGLQNTAPRYRAMQAHFDTIGPWGRRMMRQTGAVQVCLDLDGQGAGGRGEASHQSARDRAEEQRWQLLNRAGPALAAAFAASPLLDGRPSGLRSTRTAIWQGVDPARTGFDGAHWHGDAVEGYTGLALDAGAIPLPRPDDGAEPPRQSMRRWLRAGGIRPDDADLDHHLTTLFPPVRPRGYLEVRYIDALPGRWLPVPVCVLATLCAEPMARRTALDALGDGDAVAMAEDGWWRAARDGTADPGLRRTALALFDAALAGMRRLDHGYLPADAAGLVAEYRERFVATGRCPADELLEQHCARPEEPSTWT